ncbi:MAG: hypothetical protein WBA12_12635, partial [Catalinimonas sp.]
TRLSFFGRASLLALLALFLLRGTPADFIASPVSDAATERTDADADDDAGPVYRVATEFQALLPVLPALLPVLFLILPARPVRVMTEVLPVYSLPRCAISYFRNLIPHAITIKGP